MRFCFSGIVRGSTLRGLLILPALLGLVCPAAVAGGPNGDIEVSYSWLNISGSEDSFRTQQDLDEGFGLESINLNFGEKGDSRFHLSAWGFGQVSPSEGMKLEGGLGRGWRLVLDYRDRDSFFHLADPEFSERADRWSLRSWSGELRYEGWKSGSLSLKIDHAERYGRFFRPFYGLNEVYSGRVDLDESRDRGRLRFDSRSWPVHLSVEQSWAEYDRQNRWAPAGSAALDPDPDLITDLGTTFRDQQDVPTTMMSASWSGQKLAVAAQALYSSADLDSAGSGWQAFDVDGGAIGSLRFVDTLLASATTDTLVGRMVLTADLGAGWHLRAGGAYRDASSDSMLLGERLLQMTNPSGTALDLSAPIDDAGRFDFTDSSGELSLEYRAPAWSAWVGGLAASRSVGWKRSENSENAEDVNRDTTGWRIGVALHPKGAWRGNLEYERGDFEEYVFRTDPETADRLTLHLSGRISSHVSLSAHGRFESSTPGNSPDSVLDRSSDALGLSCAWTGAQGEKSLGVDLSRVSLRTDAGLILPSEEQGFSVYDMDLLSWALFGRWKAGPLKIRASLRHLDDSGESWPVDSWNCELHVGITVVDGMDVTPFLQYWSYDEDRENRDDFNATRYGVALAWSF